MRDALDRLGPEDAPPRCRADHATMVCARKRPDPQSTQELPTAELRSAIGMDHATSNINTHLNSVLERANGQARFHPRVDRVSDDLVGRVCPAFLCSVTSVNHNSFDPEAVNSCLTWPCSSVTVQRSS